jgi:hypothetical protein
VFTGVSIPDWPRRWFPCAGGSFVARQDQRQSGRQHRHKQNGPNGAGDAELGPQAE